MTRLGQKDASESATTLSRVEHICVIVGGNIPPSGAIVSDEDHNKCPCTEQANLETAS